MGQATGSKPAVFVRRVAWMASIASAIGLIESPVAAFDARVRWTPVQSIAGYRLYVRLDGQSYGPPIDVGLVQPAGGVVSYVAPNLPNGVTNVFSVSAYDALGHESARSNELALLFGTPIATPTRTRTPQPGAASPTASGPGTSTFGPGTAGTAVFTPTATPSSRRLVRFKRGRPAEGETVLVPVKISGGSGVRFVTLVATYDAAVAVAGQVGLADDVGEGTVSTNVSTPGRLSVSAVLSQPISASGVLFEVPFTARAPCRSRTDIEITACTLDGGAVGCRTGNGRIRVRCRSDS